MRTFIAWSGPLSHGVALEIKELLRLVFPNIDAFVSTEDIRQGEQWRTALTDALAESQRGIICLTYDNYSHPWVLFEAGALTRTLQRPILYTILIDDLEASMLERGPLSQFQHTRVTRVDMRRLLKQINQEVKEGCRTDADLDSLFDRLWPHTEEAVARLIRDSGKKVIKIADLARESPVIAGKVFRNAMIQGPAVLAILEGNNFIDCSFENTDTLDTILWQSMNPRVAIGAIGLSRCRFENCEFKGIGLTGIPPVLEHFRQSVNVLSKQDMGQTH